MGGFILSPSGSWYVYPTRTLCKQQGVLDLCLAGLDKQPGQSFDGNRNKNRSRQKTVAASQRESQSLKIKYNSNQIKSKINIAKYARLGKQNLRERGCCERRAAVLQVDESNTDGKRNKRRKGRIWLDQGPSVNQPSTPTDIQQLAPVAEQNEGEEET